MSRIDPPQETRCGPLVGARYKTVLHRIVVDVIHEGLQFTHLVDRVFSETSLPDGPFPMLLPRGRQCHGLPGRARASEADLDPADPLRVVVVARRKRPQKVPVLGKHHGSQEIGSRFPPHRRNGLA